MTVSELQKIVAPPEDPVHSGDLKRWQAIEEAIGIEFPKDYFAIAVKYGSGEFLSGTLEIANPFDPAYETWIEYELKKLRRSQEDSPEDMPYAVFPEADGLFPFGRDDNGNRFLWQMSGEPDNWPIVCRSSEYHWATVKESLSEFLCLLITNKLKIKQTDFWGSPFAKDDWLFEPQRRKSK